MGMYSSFVNQKITVNDENAVAQMKDSGKYPGYIATVIDESSGSIRVNFGQWDDYKIEGYFYKEMVEFLKDVAKYIDGYAEFTYEAGYNFRIVFENKKVYVQRAQVFWNNLPFEEIL